LSPEILQFLNFAAKSLSDHNNKSSGERIEKKNSFAFLLYFSSLYLIVLKKKSGSFILVLQLNNEKRKNGSCNTTLKPFLEDCGLQTTTSLKL